MARRPSGRLRWASAARRLETAGFLIATFAYLLPFFGYGFFQMLGLQFFFLTFPALGQGRFWPNGALLFAAGALPLLAGVAALLYRRRATRREAVVSLILAVTGFAGLALTYLSNPRPFFSAGYYTAEAGFLLAAVAAAFRLIGGVAELQTPARDEPALSANQWFLRRSRGDL